jgi:hypothetical protein
VFTYDSATNYNGADSFTYAVTDRGDPDSCGAPLGTCSAALTSDTKTVSITVNPLNDKPSASASPASPSTPEDTTKTVTLSGSDVETAVANLAFTITQVPANGTLKYGATTLSNGSTLSGSPKNVDYVPNTNFNGSDSFKFKVTDTGDPAGCSGGAPACSAALDSDVVTVPITVTADNDGPVVTNDNATPNQSTQFSDGITNVKVTATDVDNADTSLSLGTVSHVYTPLGGSAQPAATGLPSGLSIALTSSTPGTPSSTPGAFNPPSSKVWTISGRMTVPAGSYVITVPVTDGSAQGSTTLTIVVTKEDASLEYSGDVFKNATNSTTMNLAAVIREAGVAGGPAESPALIGNQLAGRQLNFKVYTFTGSTPIQQCTATITSTGSGTGTAGCTVTLSVSDDPYRVDVYLVDNNYYGAPIESQTLVVQINGTGFVTGGGWLNEPNLGSRSNFGFTVKRLKNGNLQGNSNYIYRKTVGANEIPYSGGFLPAGSYNWQIKSNSWAGGGLTQACTTVAPIKCTATFAGKANIKAVNRLTGVEYSLGGNYQYQVDTDDYSEPGSSPGAGPDRYAIRVWDPSTGTYYQLGSPRTWNPAQLWNTSDPGFGTRLQLSGGNIQIH